LLLPFIRAENHNMKHKAKTHISYDPDADVLSMETVGKAQIDHAEEMGDLIVHFSKTNKPVLVEILGASRLFKQKKVLPQTIRDTFVVA